MEAPLALTLEEYALVRGFTVLFSGGLDSTAVPLMFGDRMKGPILLLTFKHRYGSLFNEWSRHQIEPLRRNLGDRVEHLLIDHTDEWNEISAAHMLWDGVKYGGHFVCCLGCQLTMATWAVIHSLERNISNAYICSSVGGEYAVMSMPMTRLKKQAFYKRFGIRYNAPLLDQGIRKVEERVVVKEAGLLPGFGRRRSHNGHQPICLLGLQHVSDVFMDVHTTYDPEKVGRFLDDKFEIAEAIVRRRLQERGHDPDALIEKNLAQYHEEQAAIDALRRQRGLEGLATR